MFTRADCECQVGDDEWAQHYDGGMKQRKQGKGQFTSTPDEVLNLEEGMLPLAGDMKKKKKKGASYTLLVAVGLVAIAATAAYYYLAVAVADDEEGAGGAGGGEGFV